MSEEKGGTRPQMVEDPAEAPDMGKPIEGVIKGGQQIKDVEEAFERLAGDYKPPQDSPEKKPKT